MSDKPDLAHGIYRVTHLLQAGTKQGVAVSDLIFISGQPFAVLEWGGKPESQYPDLKIPLDPKSLSPTGKEGYFVYSGPALVDPRPIH